MMSCLLSLVRYTPSDLKAIWTDFLRGALFMCRLCGRMGTKLGAHSRLLDILSPSRVVPAIKSNRIFETGNCRLFPNDIFCRVDADRAGRRAACSKRIGCEG